MHREEFRNIQNLNEKMCRALLRSYLDNLDEPKEVVKGLYEDTIERFKEMDTDMTTEDGLTNLTIGLAQRIFGGSNSQDFVNCLDLATKAFVALMKTHAQALSVVEIKE